MPSAFMPARMLGLAQRQVRATVQNGTALWWKARYGTAPAATEGLTIAADSDPHLPPTLSRCPVCYDKTLQRSTSTVCPTCYGVGWTGGFAASVGLVGLITTGTYQLAMQDSGDLLSVAGVWLYTDPGDGLLLPQDLLIVQATPATRYLAGQTVQAPGVLGMGLVRVTQLEALAPDSPWQAVPL